MADPSPVDTRRPEHTRPGKEPFSHTRPGEAAPSARARARRVLELPEPVERSAGRAVAHRTLDRLGGPVGLAVAAAPTIAFVAAEAVAGLGTALVALAVTAVLACAVRLARREPPGAAVAGVLVAAVCAGVAAVAGEARAFFLPTTLLPAVFVAAHVVSLIARRPLLGIVVNPLVGGPSAWREHRELRRVYTVSTLVILVMAGANLLVRVLFYLESQLAVLAAIQVGVPALFAVHFAVTVVLARRAAGRPTTGSTPAPPALLAPDTVRP
ncbi:DUF3159 domain-containing protein [Streptomyces sp.]|uniref:DUF3159 domain-containing protein n=1 Tax=Streptomyces sp. TaxID=1931 RepID=UPI002811744E|nr:DUF3159 domain-containing protein [Streptomyces sp.]